MILALVIHASWGAATWFHARLPIWLLVACGGWFVAWHGSLQHETIHGHPTRSRLFNAAIGSLPLALWLPYRCYRRDHLAHHRAETVTHPTLDPESRYALPPMSVESRIRARSARLQATLAGRLLLGPAFVVVDFLFGEIRRSLRDPAGVRRDWAPHLAGCALVALWLAACQFPLWLYLASFVYPGTALTLLRSFAEHRAAVRPEHRVAIVEGGGALALLFLNNNLHAVHHRAPALPWFRLPAFYRRHRTDVLADNGGLSYRGYGEIVRRFAFRAHDVLLHPHWP